MNNDNDLKFNCIAGLNCRAGYATVCKVIIAYTHASVVLGISLLYYYIYEIIK